MSTINPHDILERLGINTCESARQVHGGMDTTIWHVTCDTGEYALRLFREDSGPFADREHAIIRAAEAAGVPVPAVVAYSTWNGRRAMLMDWCPGETVFQVFRKRPWNVRRIGYLFGKAQATLHQTSITIPDNTPDDWITRLGPIDDHLRERLLTASGDTDRLLHLDYHPLNVMVYSGEIGCILDWNNASTGDPRADVARTWSILRLMPLPPTRAGFALEQARKLLSASWLRGYLHTAGQIEDMEIFKLWAATSMVTDLQRHVGKPGSWISMEHVSTVQERLDQLRNNLGMG